MQTITIRNNLTGGKSKNSFTIAAICCHPIVIKLETGPEGIEIFSAEKE